MKKTAVVKKKIAKNGRNTTNLEIFYQCGTLYKDMEKMCNISHVDN